MAGNSHGFELSRTLSCAKATKRNSHKEAQKAHKAHNRASRTLLCLLWFLCLLWQLSADGDAQCADVAARVKGSERDCVFACSERSEVHGVDFVTAIGNPVVRKDRYPGSAVEARIRLLNLARGIVNGK